MSFTLISGSCSEIGLRPTMEDAHQCFDDIKSKPGFDTFVNQHRKCAFWGVYDGHGGNKTAQVLSLHLHTAIIQNKEFQSGHIHNALISGFSKIDSAIKKESEKQTWTSGSTCVCGLVIDDRLYVANVGDSEAILISVVNDRVSLVILTRKHQATNPQEKSRVEAIGGKIYSGRIYGILAVTRAFGDFQFKKPICNQDFVTCEPHVEEVTLRFENKYLVLGCDGLWEYMSYSQVADLTHKLFKEGASPDQVAKKLVNMALYLSSQDNITVVVVKIEQQEKPETISKTNFFGIKITTPPRGTTPTSKLEKEEKPTSPSPRKPPEIIPSPRVTKPGQDSISPRKEMEKLSEFPNLRDLSGGRVSPKMEPEKFQNRETFPSPRIFISEKGELSPRVEPEKFQNREIFSEFPNLGGLSGGRVNPKSEPEKFQNREKPPITFFPGKSVQEKNIPQIKSQSQTETLKPTTKRGIVPKLNLASLPDPLISSITRNNYVPLPPLKIPEIENFPFLDSENNHEDNSNKKEPQPLVKDAENYFGEVSAYSKPPDDYFPTDPVLNMYPKPAQSLQEEHNHLEPQKSEIRKATVGRPLQIPLNLKVAIEKIQVKIMNEGHYVGDAILECKNFGEYIVQFVASQPGTYQLEILVYGEVKHVEHILVEKFQFTYTGPQEVTTFVGYEVEFGIACPPEISTNQLRASFQPINGEPGPDDQTTIQSNSHGITLKFRPSKPGTYQTSVEIDDHGPVLSSLVVVVLSLASLKILSHSTAPLGGQHRWRMKVANISTEKLQVVVTTPVGREEKAHVVDYLDGTIDVIYTPQQAGQYQVAVKIEGLNPQYLPSLYIEGK